MLGLGATAFAAPSPYDDDFSTPSPKPQWDVIEDNPSVFNLDQSGGQLNINITGTTAANDDALFLSSAAGFGFQMSTAADFSIQADYSITAMTGFPPVSIAFGVGADLDGQDSAAIARSMGGNGGLTQTDVIWRNSDAQDSTTLGGGTNTGTFVVTYDSTLDRLTLGDGVNDFTLAFNIRDPGVDSWNADLLYVSLGARTQLGGVSAITAHLDNFVINGGTVVGVPIPEPASLVLVLAGCAVMLRRHR